MKDTADTATGVKEKEGESGEKNGKSKGGKRQSTPRETRHVVIYGYTRRELSNLMKHFEQMLPDYVKVTTNTDNLVTRITLTGMKSGVELLRFKMNRYQQSLKNLFSEELIATEDKTVAEVLGELLTERELTISCAESCTGGNMAHRITQVRLVGIFPRQCGQLQQCRQGRGAWSVKKRSRPIWRGQPASSDPDGKRCGKADAD